MPHQNTWSAIQSMGRRIRDIIHYGFGQVGWMGLSHDGVWEWPSTFSCMEHFAAPLLEGGGIIFNPGVFWSCMENRNDNNSLFQAHVRIGILCSNQYKKMFLTHFFRNSTDFDDPLERTHSAIGNLLPRLLARRQPSSSRGSTTKPLARYFTWCLERFQRIPCTAANTTNPRARGDPCRLLQPR